MNIYRKLLDVKKKVPYIQKDKKGYNYTYSTPSQVFCIVNPLLNEAGLLLITNVIDVNSYEIRTGKGEKEKTEWKYDLTFIFDWVDTEDGEKVSVPWRASGVNGEDKGLGSALTYAERYFILKQFNIATDNDDPDSFQEKHLTSEQKKELDKQRADADKELKLRAFNMAKSSLESCKTLEALQSVYLALTPDLKTETVSIKNEMKAKLTHKPAENATP